MKSLPIRVYNRRTGEMTYLPPLTPFIHQPTGRLLGVASVMPLLPGVQVNADAQVNPSDFVIMHATGWIDSEKRMVFDGDICEGDFDAFGGDEGMPKSIVRRVGVVNWHEDLGGFLLRCDGVDENDFIGGYLRRIGDIFTTPHLVPKHEKQAPRSKCCNAPVQIRAEGTSLQTYGCTKCGVQCEVYA